jgi:hypothetical protein
MTSIRLFTIGLLLVAITLARVQDVSGQKILQVPYVHQTPEATCVPAATTMILKYWGTDATLLDVAAKIGKPPIPLEKLRNTVRSYGLEFTYQPLSSIARARN